MPFVLQSPLAILGLLTLLIPIGIHLLSKARPHVVAFAHIAFIKVKTSPKLRQLRLTQLILLGLRMLMLLLATLILAQLYWQNAAPQTHSHILLTEDWLNHATNTEKQTLIAQASDSNLILLGAQNRNINTAELAQWSVNDLQTPVLNIWSKVATYATELPANSAISVYTTNSLKQFIGKQISLPKQVEWHIKQLAVESVTQHHSADIQVIYDDSSESLLVYLRAAFEVINSHEKLNLSVNYHIYEKVKLDSRRLPPNNIIIDLSEQPFDTKGPSIVITQAELKNIEQADFVLTLAQLLFSSQSQAWWLENTRLSAEQITHSTSITAYSARSTHAIPLHIYLVWILVAVFILERLLSEWPNRRLKTELDE